MICLLHHNNNINWQSRQQQMVITSWWYSQYESERHHSSVEDALTANIAVKNRICIFVWSTIITGYIDVSMEKIEILCTTNDCQRRKRWDAIEIRVLFAMSDYQGRIARRDGNILTWRTITTTRGGCPSRSSVDFGQNWIGNIFDLEELQRWGKRDKKTETELETEIKSLLISELKWLSGIGSELGLIGLIHQCERSGKDWIS